MSGILKRKLEEGPPPYLSLQGSDDDVSCSDSGNSSDSLNHSVPSGLLDSTLQQQSKRLRGRNVHFESVTVYYFNRRQGFTTVPTQGGSTLGMSPRHSGVRRFTLREFAMEQKRSHRIMLRDHLKKEKLNAIKLKLTKNGTVPSVEADTLTLDDISEDDLDVDNTEVDDYFFLQPLTTRRRRALLRSSGVRRLDVEEKHDLRALRVSREECGCRCRGTCDPETCACSLAGIKCQVDRMSFPCGCTKDGCSNNTGRLEFNPVRVRTHFLHTIMKLELEKSREEQQHQQHHQGQQQTEQQLVTNGNGYHGDSSLVQQQQPNLQFPLMSATPHIPIMHLQNTGESDSHLGEEEEEEEEEEDEEDDEAYEDDEDGSSVCSGLSDCSTHSLGTIDPEDVEEEEEDEDDEDDEEDDDDEEEDEEEDWDCTLHGTSPPPYSVPLPSVLSYSNVSLGHPFHNTPPMQHYQIDSAVNGTPAFLGKSVPIAPPTLPTVEAALESEINPKLRRQTEQQSHFPKAPSPQTCSQVDAYDSLPAPTGLLSVPPQQQSGPP
ncbi:cysteine/serine-rich nuclear protein 3-like isoform X2 [Pungitius pungitius]|uniref:cysteine/serine-rich nuclear protein 3-like isoform X2 n=1 Tax=Pungitius pungitius TaxID=134920 RepID=UPI002E106E7E